MQEVVIFLCWSRKYMLFVRFFDICCWSFMHHVTSLSLLEGMVLGSGCAGVTFAFSPLVKFSDQWGLKTDHWCSRNSDDGRSHHVKRFLFAFISAFHGSRLCQVTHQLPITMVCWVKRAVWKKHIYQRISVAFLFLFLVDDLQLFWFFHLHATRGSTKACTGWSLAHSSHVEEQQSSELMDSDEKIKINSLSACQRWTERRRKQH